MSKCSFRDENHVQRLKPENIHFVAVKYLPDVDLVAFCPLAFAPDHHDRSQVGQVKLQPCFNDRLEDGHWTIHNDFARALDGTRDIYGE